MRIKALRSVLVVALVLAGGACSKECDTTSHRYLPYHSRLMEHHQLALFGVERVDAGGSGDVAFIDTNSQLGYAIETELVDILIDTAHDQFWRVELTNRSPLPITIVWPDARFVDENAREWPIYWSNRYPEIDEIHASAPQVVQSIEKIRGQIVPVGKAYWAVYDCNSYNRVYESLVPNPIQGRTEHEINARLDALMADRTPLVLRVPIASGEQTLVLQMTFNVIEGYMRRMETRAIEGRLEEEK
jgi:hypothetical protein